MDTFSKIAESVVLEHQIAELMSQQKTTGWPFDVRRAQELENTLLTRLEKLRSQAESIVLMCQETCSRLEGTTKNKAT